VKARYFTSPSEFRAWLDRNHATARELLVGFHKVDSQKNSITYPEALDEALCFGWIDGIRKRVNVTSYTIRFTPRKPKSIWSLVNIGHVEQLMKADRMKPAGLTAFRKRDKRRSILYSHENRDRPLEALHEREFKAHKEAWKFFQSQAPSYRKVANLWVNSAKQEETRIWRLAALIRSSEKHERLDQFVSKK
jgi:uncharacterized protein YdeI (YjbR/CyaY-like superfamily)